MDVLESKLDDFKWPRGKRFDEAKLKARLLRKCWSSQDLPDNGSITLLKPGLIRRFDDQDRIEYNDRKQCYFLTYTARDDDYELIMNFKRRPDFIFKTRPAEVTLVEVKVCIYVFFVFVFQRANFFSGILDCQQ